MKIGFFKILKEVGFGFAVGGSVGGLFLAPSLVLPITGTVWRGYLLIGPMVVVGIILTVVFGKKVKHLEGLNEPTRED